MCALYAGTRSDGDPVARPRARRDSRGSAAAASEPVDRVREAGLRRTRSPRTRPSGPQAGARRRPGPSRTGGRPRAARAPPSATGGLVSYTNVSPASISTRSCTSSISTTRRDVDRLGAVRREHERHERQVPRVLAAVLAARAVGDRVAPQDRLQRVGLEHESQPRREVGIERLERLGRVLGNAHPRFTSHSRCTSVSTALEVAGQPAELVEHEQQAEPAEHDRGADDDEREVALHPAERAAEPVQREAGDEERQAEADRVRREQRAAGPHALLRSRRCRGSSRGSGRGTATSRIRTRRRRRAARPRRTGRGRDGIASPGTATARAGTSSRGGTAPSPA